MSALQPTCLRVDLLRSRITGQITSRSPRFSWVVDATHADASQHAFRLLLASSPDLLADDDGDVYDSGRPDFNRAWITDSRSVSVGLDNLELRPETVYFWKVMVWLGPSQPSPWSEVSSFATAAQFSETAVPLVPPIRTRLAPQTFVRRNDGTVFVDFGAAAFGTVELVLDARGASVLTVTVGEVLAGPYAVEREPGGSRRCITVEVPVRPGAQVIAVDLPKDERNTGELAVLLPADLPVVAPFRYCEISLAPRALVRNHVHQITFHYPFDEEAASFTSDSPVLNDVWDLCRYSIKATSFTGMYVDGDRERIPYEADSYINALAHFGSDSEYTIARRSIDHLVFCPTWPTEWHLYLVIAAWTEFLWSGDDRLLRERFDELTAKLLLPLRNADGLLDTSSVPEALLESIHFTGRVTEHFSHVGVRDIVDWPQSERDDYDMRPVNTVVNALHYRALMAHARTAAALGRTDDATRLAEYAAATRAGFRRLLLDSTTGMAVDGLGSSHSSLHANAFTLACGLLEPEEYRPVVKFLKGKGMACSVYASQLLLEALYTAGEGEYALSLLCGRGERSWAHMVYDVGSTITTEAWDDRIKPNQDWNHAWGAAPASIIPFFLMGVRPLEPGFAAVLIDPQPGVLGWAQATVPTIRGRIRVRVWSSGGAVRTVDVELPGNIAASVRLRCGSNSHTHLLVDGVRTPGIRTREGVLVRGLGSGHHTVSLAE